MCDDDALQGEDLVSVKARIELEKLRIEMRDLKRPWYQRPMTYVNTALAVSAVVDEHEATTRFERLVHSA